jgi:hypothetical protein
MEKKESIDEPISGVTIHDDSDDEIDFCRQDCPKNLSKSKKETIK